MTLMSFLLNPSATKSSPRTSKHQVSTEMVLLEAEPEAHSRSLFGILFLAFYK